MIASVLGLSWALSACSGDTGDAAVADDHSVSSGGTGDSTSQSEGTSTSSGGDGASGGSSTQAGGTSETVTSTSGQGAAGGQSGAGTGSDVGGATTTGGAGGAGATAGVGGIDGMDPDLSSLDLQRYGCSKDGDRFCYDTNQRVQLICYDYTPEVYGVCPPGERCDTRPDNLGHCEPVLPECVGQTPYVGLCVGDTYVECGVDLLDRAYEELCTDRCVPVTDGADCIHAGCGDGSPNPGEACDDGNNASGDGCSAACAWDPPLGETLEEVVGFGHAVAMSGDTIAVSSYRSYPAQPEIHVFRLDGIAWRLEALLGVPGDSTATNQEADAVYLGDLLALDGDTLAATGLGTDGDYDEAIFIFQRTGTTWNFQAKLTPASPGSPDVRDEGTAFGSSLSLSGDTLVVGAEYDGEQALFAGAAYVYRREDSVWQPAQKLFAALSGGASDAEEGATFGSSVAVSGERIVVGALAKEGATFQTGAAYVYVQDGSSWSPEARFMPPQPSEITYDTGGPQCGSAVAIADDTIVVGCRYDWEEVLAGEEPSKYAGSAYVLARSTGGWAQEAQLHPLPGVHPGDDKSIAEFGREVAISADANLVVVASPRDYTYGSGGGSAHVFRRSGSTWTAQQKLVAIPPRGGPGDNLAVSGFGNSIAISGQDVVIGSPGTEMSGRAFLYQFVDPTWELRLKLHAVEP